MYPDYEMLLHSVGRYGGQGQEVGMLVGHAFWTEDDQPEGGRRGAFEVAAVVGWELAPGMPPPQAGDLIELQALTAEEWKNSFRRRLDLRDSLSLSLEPGVKVPCLLVYTRVLERPPQQTVYHLPGANEGIIRDISQAFEILRQRPKPVDFVQWRERVSGQVGKSSLLHSLRMSRDPIELVEILLFAIGVMEERSTVLHRQAMGVLANTPATLLARIADDELAEGLMFVADDHFPPGRRMNPNGLTVLAGVADLLERLPPAQRRDLAVLLKERLVDRIDTVFAEKNARTSEAGQAMQAEIDRLGVRSPLADYDGPGQTPDKGRWIELRQRLEAMAR